MSDNESTAAVLPTRKRIINSRTICFYVVPVGNLIDGSCNNNILLEWNTGLEWGDDSFH